MPDHLPDSRCANCGEEIHHALEPFPYWFHPKGATIWCWAGREDVSFSKWGDKATPKVTADA